MATLILTQATGSNTSPLIGLGDLIDVNLGSPLADGFTLVYRTGSPDGWVAEPSTTTDEFVKVSATDTTTGHLEDKLSEGTGILFTTLNPSGNEEIEISVDLELGELNNVSLGSPVPTGYVLTFNGVDWIPSAPTGGGAANLVEGPGIDISTVGSPLLSTISLDICSLPSGGSPPTTLDLTDSIAVCDGANTLRYTLQDVSDVINVAGTGFNAITDGVNTETAAPGSQTIDFQGEDGINVTVGQTGSPSTPTVTIGFDGDLEVTIINNQPVLTILDTTRSAGSPPIGSPPTGKRLSVAEQTLMYSENALTGNDWIRIANANDTETGYIMDLQGTVVFATAHCENTGGGNSKDIHIFINGVDEGSIGTLSGGANATVINTTLNLDFNQGDRIRLQAQQGSGTAIQDTVVKLTVKWRA